MQKHCKYEPDAWFRSLGPTQLSPLDILEDEVTLFRVYVNRGNLLLYRRMNMSFGRKSTHTVAVWPDPFNQNLHPELTMWETLTSFQILSLNI